MEYKHMRILFAIALLTILGAASNAQAGDVVVICNKSISATSISTKDLQRILLGKSKKFGGTKVVLVAVKGSKADKAAFKAACKKDPRQFWMFWKRLSFTGKGNMPKDFPDAAGVVKYVAATSGAFAFVPAGTGTSGVTVLALK